jgi:predicted nucleic acid-binding protein
MNRVIADSTIWKEYLQNGNTKKAKTLEKVIKDDKVVICGYTLAEVLKDIKDKETFEKLFKGFLALPYVEIEKEDWIKAVNILFEAKQKGLNLTTEQAVLNALCETKKLTLISKKLEGGKNDL